MKQRAAVPVISLLLAALVAVPAAAKMSSFQKVQRQQQVEAKAALKAEEEAARREAIAAKIGKAKKARAIALRHGEIPDVEDDALEEMKRLDTEEEGSGLSEEDLAP